MKYAVIENYKYEDILDMKNIYAGYVTWLQVQIYIYIYHGKRIYKE